MTSISGSDDQRWRDLITLMRSHLRMYTSGSTFPEACAMLVGFDLASGKTFLQDFQEWLTRRHTDRPELAFTGMVLREVFPVGDSYRSPFELGKDEQAVAVRQLLDDIEAFLDSIPPRRQRG